MDAILHLHCRDEIHEDGHMRAATFYQFNLKEVCVMNMGSLRGFICKNMFIIKFYLSVHQLYMIIYTSICVYAGENGNILKRYMLEYSVLCYCYIIEKWLFFPGIVLRCHIVQNSLYRCFLTIMHLEPEKRPTFTFFANFHFSDRLC